MSLAAVEESEESYDEDTDSSNHSSPKPSRSKKLKRSSNYKQKFRHAWLQIPEFKDWLRPPQTINDSKARPSCSFCATPVPCSKSGIQRHGKSAGHIQKMKTCKLQRAVSHCFTAQSSTIDYEMLTEARVCGFIAENNLPFSLANSVIDLVKALCPSNSAEKDSLQKMSMSRTKCVNIARQGLGFNFSKSLVEILKTTMFSIIPDETTDISSEKQLALCVVYFDYEKMEPVTSFFDMAVVEKCDAQSLYDAIKKCFEDKDIPLNNIIGFASDTCNVMFGERHSVAALMKADYPNISFVKCSCHIIHLCVSHACLKLSTSLEDLCRNIYAHFSRSSLRQHELKEFQQFLNISPHKMLSFGQTRWLSLEACVSRILEQWDALTLYFTSVVSENHDPSYVTDSILRNLNNPFIKAQLQFVQVQLHRVNEFNTLFQSSSPQIQNLHDQVEKLVRELMGNFIQVPVVRNCDPLSFDVESARFHVPLEDVYIGIGATDTVLNSSICKDTEGIKKFKATCKAFLIELVNQIRTRFQVKPLKLLSFITPENAMNMKPRSLREVFKAFPYLQTICNCEYADLEWRNLGIDTEVGSFGENDVVEFWKSQLGKKKMNGEPKYPNLMKVVGCVMSLPHSNAAVERVFSQLNLIKTDLRNSLKPCSLVSLLHIKNGLKRVGISAHELTMDSDLRKVLKQVKSNATESQCQDILSERYKI